ncbi:PLP-dependent aminotransferase family protein [Bacillus solimangrovi]|uniref:HTH gntR-type domain-containing protein n=1 Tax=Bacillus solimangrovi TaxID=1305675 RepID=A0A1E5LHL4_9BACI|nr:PLP-dependent aminotransferase family protein [Bacillus solimangrovi]OEH93570.1 hypothetical protein BFG57_00860 [Bacillus solimangrovi]
MLEITLTLEHKGYKPIYIQVYEYFKNEIETGRIPPKSKLPSIRGLAEHLCISRNTIENAYQQLITEGYVHSEPRKRLIVNDIDNALLSQLHSSQLQTNDVKEHRVERFLYDFRYGNVDLDNIPHTLWKRQMNEVLAMDDEHLIFYGNKKGDLQLRQQLAHYLFQSRGISCTADEVIIGAGMYQLLSIISQMFLRMLDTVAVENPCYDGARRVFINHGFTIQSVPLESDGLSIAQLEKGSAKAVYVTPSHQFPMGMILPIQKRLSLLKWASENDSFIIEDDYDSEFRYQGKPIPALKALDRNERVIYIGTFSKSFMPSIRVNYMVLPKRLLNIYDTHFATYNQPVATIIQRTLAQLLEKGIFERHIRKMRKIYSQKHTVLIEAIKQYMGEYVHIQGTQAGLHVIIRIENQDEEKLLDRALASGINIYSADKYWMERPKDNAAYFLLGFGELSHHDIVEGIKKLSYVWFDGE